MEQNQNIQNKDVGLVLTEIAKSNNIFSYSRKELITLLNNKTVLVFYNTKKLIGLSAYENINKNWVELALLLVISQYRNQGYGKKLYEELLQLLEGKNVYCCSRNPVVQKWLKEDNFEEVSFYKLPKEVVFYLIRKKIKLHKLKDFIRKGLLGGWKYYLRVKKTI